LKYDPSVIEIPVPRYFKDIQDRIPVELKFTSTAMNRKAKKEGKKKKNSHSESRSMKSSEPTTTP
jgi:hypothetical protein